MEEKPNINQAALASDQDIGDVQDEALYITGWRLHSISFGLLLSLFIAQMDTSIASTSILTIIDDLGGFKKSSWVFTSYLLSFYGMPLSNTVITVLSAKTHARVPTHMGQAFRHHHSQSSCLGYASPVPVFSAACGASQTLTQLIMFR